MIDVFSCTSIFLCEKMDNGFVIVSEKAFRVALFNSAATVNRVKQGKDIFANYFYYENVGHKLFKAVNEAVIYLI